jgi:sugar transferase (PEP-CTERM system associated)
MTLRSVWPIRALAVGDALVLFAVLLASHWAAAGWGGAWPELSPYAGRVAMMAGLCAVMMFALGLFSWHIADSYADLAARVAVAFGLAFVVYAITAYVLPGLRIPLTALVPGLSLAALAVFALHAAFLRVADLAHLKIRILVLGTGARAARVAALAERGRLSRFSPVAFVELERVPCAVDPAMVIAMPNDLVAFARAQAVDEIVVAVDDRRGQLPLDALVTTRLQGLPVTDYVQFAETALGAVDLDNLRHSWFLDRNGFRAGKLYQLVKRASDIALSAGLLLATLPLLLSVALAIKLESPGGVFYRQERVGKGGRTFMLTKFRSMRDDAEADGRPQWARQGDARVTRVGAVIRKTRIDEIPQAFNVLRGDMSFVGPRPERPFFVETLSSDIPFYRERHHVKPGLTGWAQLNYPYGASVEDAKMKLQYDLFYIKHFSILLDLAIVLQTVRVVLWNAGAR